MVSLQARPAPAAAVGCRGRGRGRMLLLRALALCGAMALVQSEGGTSTSTLRVTPASNADAIAVAVDPRAGFGLVLPAVTLRGVDFTATLTLAPLDCRRADSCAPWPVNYLFLVRFLPVSQYLLELASGVWVLECGMLTSREA